jgi:hypothetical protein
LHRLLESYSGVLRSLSDGLKQMSVSL